MNFHENVAGALVECDAKMLARIPRNFKLRRRRRSECRSPREKNMKIRGAGALQSRYLQKAMILGVADPSSTPCVRYMQTWVRLYV